eukprot:2285566-Pyramimonas_sp.AAC.1
MSHSLDIAGFSTVKGICRCLKLAQRFPRHLTSSWARHSCKPLELLVGAKTARPGRRPAWHAQRSGVSDSGP